MSVRRVLVALVPALSLFGGGCATVKIDRPRVEAIHRVALVGFTVKQQMPQLPELSFGAKHGPEMMPVHGAVTQTSQHATEMYADLAKLLGAEMKWSVIDRARLEKSAAYTSLYAKTTKGWQNRPPVGNDIECFGAPGVVDDYPIERLDADERRGLMKALGVDALVTAEIQIALEHGGGLKQLVGAGEYKPRATTRFAVWDKTAEEPVWRDVAATGGTPEQGANHIFGVANPDTVNEKAVWAAQSSYQKLIVRFKEENG